jgi:hypothetical protein
LLICGSLFCAPLERIYIHMWESMSSVFRTDFFVCVLGL